MKKYLLIAIALFAVVATGCKKEEPSRDYRDDYVGDYLCTHGSLVANMYDKNNKPTLPFTLKECVGKFTISKYGTKTDGNVKINSSYWGDMTGFVDANGNLHIDSKEIKTSDSKSTTSSTLYHNVVRIKDNVLDWNTRVKIKLESGSLSFYGEGTMETLAVKEK